MTTEHPEKRGAPGIEIRLVPDLEPQEVIAQDALPILRDLEREVRAVVERDAEVPLDVHERGDVAQEVQNLGGVQECGGLRLSGPQKKTRERKPG